MKSNVPKTNLFLTLMGSLCFIGATIAGYSLAFGDVPKMWLALLFPSLAGVWAAYVLRRRVE